MMQKQMEFIHLFGFPWRDRKTNKEITEKWQRERKESDSSFILDLYYWAYILLGFLYVHFELILLSL